MRLISRFYLWINLLSIDVAAGAGICAVYWSHRFNANIPAPVVFVLVFTVWIIYTVDHLLDAVKQTGTSALLRYEFHKRNFTPITLVVSFATLSVLGMLLMIDFDILKWGIPLALIVAAYLFFSNRIKYFKEFLIGIIYCSGVLLPTLVYSKYDTQIFTSLEVPHFILIVLTNLYLLSWFEIHDDSKHKRSSLTVHAGEKNTGRLLFLLLILQAILASIQLISDSNMNAFILSLMSAVLALIFLFHSEFRVSEKYRLYGDAIFLLPLIPVLCENVL